MILYSVTISLPEQLEEEWLHWLREIHIPEVMDTGYFSQYRLHRLLEPIVEAGYVTYNVLYTTDSLQSLHNYRMHAGFELQRQHLERFGEAVFVVCSVMEMC